MTEYYFVGKIINTHGLKGEVKVKAETDFPQQRFCPNSSLYISAGDQKVKMTVETCLLYTSDAADDIALV